jgi:hypothetical protein
MAGNRITSSGATRGRALRRLSAVAATVALVAAMACALAACGGGGSSNSTATTAPATTGTATNVDTPMPTPEESADAELLNKVLGRQEAASAAYSKVTSSLSPALSRRALIFRRQEQEHIDAVLKALRGLKAPAEPREEEIPVPEMETERERLEFLYEVENGTIDEELSAISQLEAAWPRSLLASTVANQAQHLTLLRQALAAGPLASVPEPFEDGTTPPPLG